MRFLRGHVKIGKNKKKRFASSVITAQVLVEFWVVATRPIAVNGLGWSAEQARTQIAQLLVQLDTNISLQVKLIVFNLNEIEACLSNGCLKS